MSGIITFPQQAAGATPAAGNDNLFFKTDGFLYFTDSAGVEHKVIDTYNSYPFRKNLLINGGAEVAQDVVRNLTTGAQYSTVDMCSIWASGGAVSAGTLTQVTTSVAGRTGKAARAAGTTLTGSGVISWRYRMEAADALKYKNTSSSFSIKVAHDVGSNINYTAIIRKATVADNFAGVTVISTGSPTAVVTATGTTLSLANVAMGDCSNGIEIEVQAACGAVTTKNFDFTEWQLEVGSVTTDFEHIPFTDALQRCLRYFEKSFTQGVAPAQNTGLATGAHIAALIVAGAVNIVFPVPVRFAVIKRSTPTITYFNPAAANAFLRNAVRSTDATVTSTNDSNNGGFSFNYTGAVGWVAGDDCRVHWTADARL
jgi:hypothetical protein